MRRYIYVTFIVVILGSVSALANWGSQSGGGLFCSLVGCTMSGGLVFDGVSIDLASASNQDLVLRAQGSGKVQIIHGTGETTQVTDSTGATVRGELKGAAGSLELHNSTGGSNDGYVSVQTTGNGTAVAVGTPGDQTAGINVLRVMDSAGDLFVVDGEGGGRFRQHTTGSTVALRLPGGIAATVPTKPACTASTDEGSMVYLNDTNDGVTAQLCVCGRWSADDTTYSWARIETLTASSCTL